MENLNQDQTVQEQVLAEQSQPKSPFPKFILILIAVLVFGIIGGAYYLLEIKKNELKACTLEAKQCSDGSYVSRTGPNCEFSSCPTTKNSGQKTENDETSNWKTYENKKLGFSIKYPKNLEEPVWPCHTDNSVCLTIKGYNTGYKETPNKMGGAISIYRGEGNLNDFCKDKSKDSSIVSCEQSSFNGLAAFKKVRIVNDGFNNDENRIFYVTHDKYYYLINEIFVRTDSLTEKEIDQILSTFTFASLSASKSPDQNSTIDTSNWKTYTSTKNRISFKYPPEWDLKVEPNSYTGFDQISITLNKKYPHPNKPSEYIEGIDKQFTIYPVTDNGQRQFTNWVPNSDAVFDGRKCQGKVIEATQQVGAETYYECIVNGINYGISLVTVTDNNASSYAALNLIRSTFKFTQ